MNVLSLFDGMSCGQIALNRAGIKYDKYFASEIDKYAIQVTQHNYPDTIQIGSVTEVDVSNLAPIDLLIGGSPCQSFSFAGKRNGMTTTCNEEIYTLEKYLELKNDGFKFEGESYLFWEYMRILTDIRKYNPNVLFLLENVEMGNKWERVLSEAIGIFGVHINSALVSAQNRKRIYWTNIRVREEGLFGELHSDIPQPEDRGILLKDILEDEVDEKYYLSDKMLNYFNDNSKRQKENGNGLRFSALDDFNTKSKTITTKEGGRMESNFLCVAMRGRGENNEQQLEPQLSGKTNSLTSVQKDNLVVQVNTTEYFEPCEDKDQSGLILTGNMRGGKWEKMHESSRRVYDPKGKAPTVSTMQGGNQHPKTTTNARIRRLTPTECMRLQTIPQWYKFDCSDTQQYRMLGNGWTVDVIKHIFKQIKWEGEK